MTPTESIKSLYELTKDISQSLVYEIGRVVVKGVE